MAAVGRNGSYFGHIRACRICPGLPEKKEVGVDINARAGRGSSTGSLISLGRGDASLAKPQAATHMTLVRGCGYDCILVQ